MDTGIAHRALDVAVVATSDTTPTGMFAMLDILSAVGRDWEFFHHQPPRPPSFRPMLLSLDGEPFREPNGVTIVPHGMLSDHPSPDIVIVPDLQIDPSAPYPNSYATIADWIRAAYDKGAIVSSVCSGSLLLAETGLLDDMDAATHWGCAVAMAARYPKIRVRQERIIIPAGEGHRVITAGAGSSWFDLLLYIVGRFASIEEARRVARIWLLQWHADGQLPYASLTAGRANVDQMISAAQVWAADNYASPNAVASMVRQSGLTERGFLKRFRRVTGQSPIEYLQTLRIEEAKQLLEVTAMPLDEIAAEVGYAETTSFRRLFRKLVGTTPAEYRRKRVPSISVLERY